MDDKFPGDQLAKLIEEACKRNSSLEYCNTSKQEKKDSTPDRFRQNSYALSITDVQGMSPPFAHDVVLEEEILRSSDIHKANAGSDYCNENESRYRYYCQGAVERSSKLQKKLYDYCIRYEQQCQQKASEQSSDTKMPNANGFIEQPISGTQVNAYCEQYMPNFLYFCVGDDSNPASQRNRIERFCYAYSQNCPENLEKVSANFPQRAINTGTTTSAPVIDERKDDRDRAEIVDYCNEYAKNHQYYCINEPKATMNKKIESFCRAFTKICTEMPTFKTKNMGPSDPFRAFVEGSSSEVSDTFENPEALKEFMKSKSFEIPCTPDCNQTVHPHCTPECKCDFLYPAVQKFCNPAPLSIFLITCRIWYAFCPKYKQYHYASQFIRSKAEKGKVEPGTVTPVGSTTERRDASLPVSESLIKYRRLPTLARFGAHRDAPWNRVASGFGLVNLLPMRARAYQSSIIDENIHAFDSYTDSGGRVKNQLHSRSPYTKPGLWEANPSNPHNRDHANKFVYLPDSVGVDWLQGQVAWGGHWAVPAVDVGGANGFTTLHFPALGTFAGIEDDYDY